MASITFEVTSIAPQVVSDKLQDVLLLENRLNDRLGRADYGPSVEEMFIVFHVVDAEKTHLQPELLFHPEDKLLQLILKLPRREIRGMSRDETLAAMESLLIRTAESMLPDLRRLGFRADRFVEDLRREWDSSLKG